eukprot:CFRG7981T1
MSDFEYTIDSSGRNLKLSNEADVARLVEEIKACKDLTSIRLSNTSIGVEAAQAIADALEEHPEIEVADFSDSFTGRLLTEIPDAVRSFGAALMDKTKLRVLDFSNNAFGPIGAKAVKDLVSNNVHIQELRFVNNGLGVEGGRIMAESIKSAAENAEAKGLEYELKVFRAGRNRLENEGATALAYAFKRCPHLKEVALPQNGINHPGITALFKGFEGKSLEILDLNDNTFTYSGAQSAAAALPSMPMLTSIDFGDCLLTSDGVLAVCEAMESSVNQHLKTINLSFNEADTYDAADAISQMVAAHPKLESVDVHGNDMDRAMLDLILETSECHDILLYTDVEEDSCEESDC